MPDPLLLIIGPLLPALLLFLLRRWPAPTSLLGALFALILWFITATISLPSTGPGAVAETWHFSGRSFILTEPVQAALAVSYLILALLIGLSWLLPQGRLFAPGSLALMSPLAALLMIQPIFLGLLLLLLVGTALAVLIQGGRAGSTLAATRYLAMILLAVPLLLVAEWLLQADPAAYLTLAARLFLIGYVILMAGFPVYAWVVSVLAESRTLAPAVVFGLGQLVITVFLFNLLQENPAVQRNLQLLELLQISGVLTMLLGGLLALLAGTFRRLLAYLLLIDMGAALLTLAAGTQAGLETTYSLLILRCLSLILAGTGLGLIRGVGDPRDQGPGPIVVPVGLARAAPLGLALFVFGGLSLIGFPLTLGYSGHWAALMLARQASPWLAAGVVAASALGAISLLRFVLRILPASEAPPLDEPLSEEEVIPANGPLAGRPAGQILAGVLLVAGLLLTIFPRLLLIYAERIAALR